MGWRYTIPTHRPRKESKLAYDRDTNISSVLASRTAVESAWVLVNSRTNKENIVYTHIYARGYIHARRV